MKKHIKIAISILAITTLIIIIVTDIGNIIWGSLLGLVFAVSYLLTILGFNPLVNGLRIFWQGGDINKNKEIKDNK
jgi:hypothetical protein